MKTNINVEFNIIGDYFDLDTISNKLNLNPTESWKKGEVVPNRKTVRRDTTWSYALGTKETIDLDEELTNLVNIFDSKREILKKLKLLFELEYLILITIKIENQETPAMTIRIPNINFINDIACELEFDTYVF